MIHACQYAEHRDANLNHGRPNEFLEREMWSVRNPPTPEACWKGYRTQLPTLVDNN